jgi:transposase-like protein
MARTKDTPIGVLVEGLLTQEDGSTMKMLLQALLNRLLEAERTEHLRAEPHERTSERRGYRNGYQPREMSTRLGTISLQVPRTRDGEFSTAMFQRYQRSERALQLGLAEMYVKGVSTRKVADVTEALFGTEFSATTVSNLAQELDEEIAAWRERPLEERFPYLIADGQYHKVREGGRVVSMGVLTVTGITEEGVRRVLDFEVATGETETSWTELFKRLKRRGLKGVVLVVSDDHAGLRGAVERCFTGAAWQRCQFHFQGNLRDLVARKDQREIAETMRWVWAARTYEEAQERLRKVIAELGSKHPRVAEKLAAEGEQTLAVYHLPAAHRVRLRTTNGLERLHLEIRRRSRVVGIFPNAASVARLVGAMLIEQDERWMTAKRYLNMDKGSDGERGVAAIA